MRIIGVLAPSYEVWDAIIEFAEAYRGVFNKPNTDEEYDVHPNDDPTGVTIVEMHNERWYNEISSILEANFTLAPMVNVSWAKQYGRSGL